MTSFRELKKRYGVETRTIHALRACTSDCTPILRLR